MFKTLGFITFLVSSFAIHSVVNNDKVPFRHDSCCNSSPVAATINEESPRFENKRMTFGNTTESQQNNLIFSQNYKGYIVPSGFYDEGSGYYYESPYSFVNSYHNDKYQVSEHYVYGDFSITYLDNNVKTTKTFDEITFYFRGLTSGYYLQSVMFINNNIGTFMTLFSGTDNVNFVYNQYIIYVNSFDENSAFLDEDSIMGDLFQPLKNTKGTFTFARNWNYNADYMLNTDSIYVNDTYFVSGVMNKTIYIDLPLFESNGVIYNRLRLDFMNGMATSYMTDDGIKLLGLEHFGYYSTLMYLNTITGDSAFVNDRIRNWANSNNTYTSYIAQGTTFLNSNYMRLNFYFDLSPSELTSLSKYNDNSFSNGFIDGSDNHALENAFTLVNTALTGIVGFFSWVVLPGITIGTLLMIPLAISLIIFVIKLFKR